MKDMTDKIKKQLEDMPLIIGKRDKYINAAVMIPLIMVDEAIHVLYQVRSKHIRQGGEISFPGGMVEELDNEDYMKTAIRETVEELGVDEDNISMIGHLGTMVSHSDMTIDVYIGWLKHISLESLELSEEVAEVFTVPLKELLKMEPEIHFVHMEVQPTFVDEEGDEVVLLDVKALGLPPRYNKPWGMKKRKLYFYRYLDRIIWGLTGEMTYEFLNLVK